jgi:hypothetical protein
MKMNLIEQGLFIQQMQVKANKKALNDADVKRIKEAGMHLVHKPDHAGIKTISIADQRVMSAHASPEAA